MHITIRRETPGDEHFTELVHRQAFGQDDEGRLVAALRAGGYVRVGLVAEEDGSIVGHILFSALCISTSEGALEALALAPVAVVPSHQRRGIGSELVREGLRICAEAGHRIVVVVGHPDFYPRFGFSAKLAEPLASPYSGAAFMALELIPGALRGVTGQVEYPPPFFSLEDGAD